MTYKDSKGRSIVLSEKPFAEGGEGKIFNIISPPEYVSCCVKLFTKHSDHLKESKIRYQIEKRPKNISDNSMLLCWPLEVVYKNGAFAGMIMPLAFKGSVELQELVLPYFSREIPEQFKIKYDINKPDGILARLKLCVNISRAVHYIHSVGHYVIVDWKPQNVLFTVDGKVSITDLDSIQISDSGKLLFEAQCATPEYVPAEAYVSGNGNFRSKSWDHFSLAVGFYRIFLGCHPYASSKPLGKFEGMVSLDEKIAANLFVHGKNSNHIGVIPAMHRKFNKFPDPIQKLFLQAFEATPATARYRPSAETWGNTLFEEIRKIEKVKKKA